MKLLFLIILISNFIFANTQNIEIKTTINNLLKQEDKPIFFISDYKLKLYYKAFNYKLIWSDENGIKDISLQLLEKVKNDPVLKPEVERFFSLNLIMDELKNLDRVPEKHTLNMTKIDFMFTSIYSKYLDFLSKGSIDWNLFQEKLSLMKEEESIKTNWEKYNVRKNKINLLKKALLENDINFAIKAVEFTFPNAQILAEKINELEKISLEGGYTKLPNFKLLKEGNKSTYVKLLRKRLLQSQDLKTNECTSIINASNLVTNNIDTSRNNQFTIPEKNELIENDCLEVFDDNVKNAVISFQKNHGLEADGIVGSVTRAYLNIPVEEKIKLIRLNIERMRWMPRNLGQKYLIVNIPEYKLRMYNKEEIKLDMNVVVGTKNNPTPIFSNKISFIVLNPYWRIPYSIVREEIIPKILENPNYLKEKGINIHETWDDESQKVELENIDLTIYEKEDEKEIINQEEALVSDDNEKKLYKFIQEPNNHNPLGRMKFMFPNRYSVYLHDSPAKEFFKYTNRAYSHGCIRLEEPKKLLEAISNEDNNLKLEDANEVLTDIKKSSIDLEKKIPVHIVYITSWVDERGILQFRNDIYNFDKIQSEILYKN